MVFFTQVSLQVYQAQMLAGVVEAARKANANADLIRLCLDLESAFRQTQHEYEKQLKLLCNFANKIKLDGIISLGWACPPQKLKSYLNQDLNIPIISLGTNEPDFISVFMPGDPLIEEMVRHLVLKHKLNKIVFLSPILYSDLRPITYKRIMQELGIFDPAYLL